MLSYKDYKKLNESLYGAFNLGLRSPNVVAGIVSDSEVNGTEASIEAQAEEAIEEAKKMKKKMKREDEEVESEKEDKEVDDKEESEEEDDHDEEEESEDDDHDEEESEEEEEEEEEEESAEFMKKKSKKCMNKKSKKEWTEIVAELEKLAEEISDEEAVLEIKKGLETIKEGVKKGHKKGCDCNFCKNAKAKDGDEEEGKSDDDEGLTDAQKKLPKALQDAILAKKGKKKSKDDKSCGKKCGKYMNEEEQAWWNSVNGMLGSDINQKNWDGGWSEVGEVGQAVRESADAGGEYVIEVVFKDGKKERFTNVNYEKIKSQYEMLSYKPEIDQMTLFNAEGKALASTNSSSLKRKFRGVVG